MTSLLEETFVRSPQMVSRQVAGEYLLVPLVGRGADLDSIFNLNPVGAFVWEKLDGHTSGAQIVLALVDHFLVDHETAEADYCGFIEELRSIGALATSGG